MRIEGIYFSTAYWPRLRTLWAYRFYADGVVLFTYADPVGRFVLHTEAAPTVCHPADILGNKSKVPQFLRYFSRESPTRITYRSGLPAITQGHYTTTESNISLSHPYFHCPPCSFAGQILPGGLVLSLVRSRTASTDNSKSPVERGEVFVRLDPARLQ
jgi:hypothetical protein